MSEKLVFICWHLCHCHNNKNKNGHKKRAKQVRHKKYSAKQNKGRQGIRGPTYREAKASTKKGTAMKAVNKQNKTKVANSHLLWMATQRFVMKVYWPLLPRMCLETDKWGKDTIDLNSTRVMAPSYFLRAPFRSQLPPGFRIIKRVLIGVAAIRQSIIHGC